MMEKILKNRSSMSPSLIKIAEFVLSNYLDAAFLNISDLAEYTGTSTATISRFVKTIGYDGFAPFQTDLKDLLRKELSLLSRFSTRTAEGAQKTDHIGTRLLDEQERSFEGIRQILDSPEYSKAVDLLTDSARILLIGFHGLKAIAEHAFYKLGKVAGNVDLIDSWWDYSEYRKIRNPGSGTTVVIFAFKRYQKYFFKIMKQLEKTGCNVLLFTDSELSPFIAHATLSLIIKTTKFSFYEILYCPLIALLDSLIMDIAYKNYSKTKTNLERFEEYLAFNDIY